MSKKYKNIVNCLQIPKITKSIIGSQLGEIRYLLSIKIKTTFMFFEIKSGSRQGKHRLASWACSNIGPNSLLVSSKQQNKVCCVDGCSALL